MAGIEPNGEKAVRQFDRKRPGKKRCDRHNQISSRSGHEK
jgi:hypothetical protein